jgi:hypothetical protein
MNRTRIAIIATLLAIVLGLAALFGFVLPRLMAVKAAPRILNTAAILLQVQTLSQLVTIKYVIEKVVILEDVKWYGESRVLMVAHGIVKAGVDLSQLKPEQLKVTEEKVIITLPKSQITDVYLDEQKTRVVERSTGVLRTFDTQLEQNARQQAVESIRRAARNNGIQDEADERARLQLGNLFHQLGYKDVEFRTE